MKYAITGATGLLGGNLAATLLQQGHNVVATRRATSKVAHLAHLDIQWMEATLGDVEALTAAFQGCDGVFHCAAAVSVVLKIEPWIRQANVDGTRHVIQAVQAAGVQRLVHCSTVGAVGLSLDGEPLDETAQWNMPEFGLGDAYVTTKHQAQQIVLEAAEAGLDAVIVNPTYMIGPLDSRPSSGGLVLSLMQKKIPSYTLGKNNFVDVRDVAKGMVLAMEKGHAGELYILGGHNMTYKDFMDRVSDTVGAPMVTRQVPQWVVRCLGWMGDLGGLVTGKEPFLNTAKVRWGMTDRFIFRSDKAIAKLGYKISPIEPAIKDAAEWFKDHDML